MAVRYKRISIINYTRFYALYKIHKCALAFYPTDSNINSASYNFARFFLKSLNFLK